MQSLQDHLEKNIENVIKYTILKQKQGEHLFFKSPCLSLDNKQQVCKQAHCCTEGSKNNS